MALGSTVATLKQELEQIRSVPVSFQDLIFEGKVLKDSKLLSATLASHKSTSPTPFITLHRRKNPRTKKEYGPGEDCAVCLEQPANVRLQPCKHHLCSMCAPKCTECPFCRERIVNSKPAGSSDHHNCHVCHTRLSLIAAPCKCGHYFCEKHRYEDQHNCEFDFKTEGRARLKAALPRVSAGVAAGSYWQQFKTYELTVYWDVFTASAHNRRMAVLTACCLLFLMTSAPCWVALPFCCCMWAFLCVLLKTTIKSNATKANSDWSPIHRPDFTIMADVRMAVTRLRLFAGRQIRRLRG